MAVKNPMFRGRAEAKAKRLAGAMTVREALDSQRLQRIEANIEAYARGQRGPEDPFEGLDEPDWY